MSTKRTPRTEPMVQAANLQKPLPQIQVQSLIVPMGQPLIFKAARTRLGNRGEQSIKNNNDNNNNNQKYNSQQQQQSKISIKN